MSQQPNQPNQQQRSNQGSPKPHVRDPIASLTNQQAQQLLNQFNIERDTAKAAGFDTPEGKEHVRKAEKIKMILIQFHNRQKKLAAERAAQAQAQGQQKPNPQQVPSRSQSQSPSAVNSPIAQQSQLNQLTGSPSPVAQHSPLVRSASTHTQSVPGARPGMGTQRSVSQTAIPSTSATPKLSTPSPQPQQQQQQKSQSVPQQQQQQRQSPAPQQNAATSAAHHHLLQQRALFANYQSLMKLADKLKTQLKLVQDKKNDSNTTPEEVANLIEREKNLNIKMEQFKKIAQQIAVQMKQNNMNAAHLHQTVGANDEKSSPSPSSAPSPASANQQQQKKPAQKASTSKKPTKAQLAAAQKAQAQVQQSLQPLQQQQQALSNSQLQQTYQQRLQQKGSPGPTPHSPLAQQQPQQAQQPALKKQKTQSAVPSTNVLSGMTSQGKPITIGPSNIPDDVMNKYKFTNMAIPSELSVPSIQPLSMRQSNTTNSTNTVNNTNTNANSNATPKVNTNANSNANTNPNNNANNNSNNNNSSTNSFTTPTTANNRPSFMNSSVVSAPPPPPPRPAHLQQEPPEGSDRVLNKRKLKELVRSISSEEGDPEIPIDADVEDLLLDLADEFVTSVTSFACRLVKHRKSENIEPKDVQFHLERNWNIRVPGYSADEIRTVKKYVPAGLAGAGAVGHKHKGNGVSGNKGFK
ncbi:unnamed protein product [Ambrosiozyma monospora]|uniref:Unnamed protein product n=1 Tax=Ambrosiozyma monospora TaxID=43982 RepID=A0ACB5STE5_AMBMO|nr:unnamed protein product [Ambrosiozyma monospora]